MKIGIKVSDISSLLNFNNFKTKEIVIKNIKSRLYKQNHFDDYSGSLAAIEAVIESYSPIVDDDRLEGVDGEKIVLKEYENYFIYCLESELNVTNGLVIDTKTRISPRVKYFIPNIDLIHCQFYMLLGNCRRCILREVWSDGHSRQTAIKFDEEKVLQYSNILNTTIPEIIY